MAITVDISKLPNHLRREIISEIEFLNKDKVEPNFGSNLAFVPNNNDKSAIITLKNNHNVNRIKRMLKDLLIKYKVRDYVVIIDPNEKEKIVVSERSHLENAGKYQCIHCGMEFENEIQYSIHHRIHYLI